jgi:hypothetical protein
MSTDYLLELYDKVESELSSLDLPSAKMKPSETSGTIFSDMAKELPLTQARMALQETFTEREEKVEVLLQSDYLN